MDLGDWLKSKNISHTRFAQMLHCDRATISRAVRKVTLPTPELMREIARLTDNQVTPNDFIMCDNYGFGRSSLDDLPLGRPR